MNIRFCIFLLLIIISNSCLGQQSRTNNWVLGDSVLVNFDTNPPNTGLSALESFEGFSVISDTNGTLLFYTNGIKVWNSNHQLMPNGFGLNSSITATNAALIVPKPSSDNIYYIFTVGGQAGYFGDFGGLAYSIVDMNLNGGSGDVTQKNVVLQTKSTEKLCATLHENNTDFWIMSHDFGNNQFRAYLLTSNGINSSPKLSKVGAIHYEYPIGDWGQNTAGSMRFSPSGCKLALVLAGAQKDTIQLFNFDKSSGYLFEPITLKSAVSQNNPYVLCFSPDNSKLYVSGFDWIVQFNLASNLQSSIQQSKTIIASNTLSESGSSKYEFHDLQIAPNGKIYVARVLTNYLSSINFPNNSGSSCDFVDTAILFSNYHCEYSLPNFVSNFLVSDTVTQLSCKKYCPTLDLGVDKIICDGDTAFIDLDLQQGELMWNDGSTDFSNSIMHEGIYFATYNFNNCPTQIDSIKIIVIKNNLDDINDFVLCLDDTFNLILPNDLDVIYSWSNGITGNVFTTLQSGSFFLSISKNNCVFFDYFQIINDCIPVFEIPNVFSPNNDNINDYFTPTNIKNIDRIDISILNRWGNIVHNEIGVSFSWDGYCKGTKCSNGVYFYKVKITSLLGEEYLFQGFITLLE
jgi:gliding motility-associated-like protein